MSRRNPFQTFAHCWRFALRRAAADGDTFHVVVTGLPDAPRTVLSDRELFACNELAPDDVEASADPFLPGFGVTHESRANDLR
ncbi:hypothetical protein [Sphingomonas sp. CARO-RG-8B-R24-01]|uniref:hypothetical protein n=1 Tax=Sphingomonas sp. CARO-RG-8B-R24-01 TaxID=2914831 RepID=UPI001F588C75|nr:hypothetical protein [Sphingomonas sp. CARO-RG-8B-R24-01]